MTLGKFLHLSGSISSSSKILVIYGIFLSYLLFQMTPNPAPCDYKANEGWFLWNILSPFIVILRLFLSVSGPPSTESPKPLFIVKACCKRSCQRKEVKWHRLYENVMENIWNIKWKCSCPSPTISFTHSLILLFFKINPLSISCELGVVSFIWTGVVRGLPAWYRI